MHTFIIIIGNEPALGINEPINQGLLMNTVQNKTPHCLFVILCSSNPPMAAAHPASSEAIDQPLGRRLVCHFSLASPGTKPGSVCEITAQDAT